MAGLLSSMFHDDGQTGGHHQAEHGGDHAGSDQSSTVHDHSSGEHSAGSHADLDPNVSFHSDVGGSYETMDGTTHSWSNTQDVSATVDVDAVFDAGHGYQADAIEG